MRGAAALRDAGHGAARVLFAQGVHPADAAVPRRLPLLHLRAAAARRRAPPISSPERGAGDRPRRRRGRLHARRCSRSATSRSCATARRARRWRALGHDDDARLSRRDGARWCCSETGLLPHVNPGRDERAPRSRCCAPVSVSQGIMLESAAERLCAARRAAFRLARQGAGARGSRPSRRPAKRRCRSPRGILIGIGETRARAHRGAARAARPARALRPHPGNHHPEFPRQARHAHGGRAASPTLDDHLWTIAVARLDLRRRR